MSSFGLTRLSTKIATGSVKDMAERKGVELEVAFFTDVDEVILYDDSGSMGQHDARGGRSREEVAIEELERLQAEYEGRIALVEFSNFAQLRPTGIPSGQHGGTDLCAALELAKCADGLDIGFTVISDGQPDDAFRAIKMAKTFTSRINTIYIGPEYGSGKQFLEQLASASGGKSFKSKEVGLLGESMRLLMAG